MDLYLGDKRIICDVSFHIEIFENVISQDMANELLESLTQCAKWKNSFITKSGNISKRRNKSIYGSIQTYSATFRGKNISSPVHNWDEIPILKELADNISSITRDQYNTCVLQYYANEEVGINPHRDKEVLPDNCITSISLGSTRIMRFERNGTRYDIPLPSGSLCVIYPPTNTYWAHSILCEKEAKSKRISLVFRHHPQSSSV